MIGSAGVVNFCSAGDSVKLIFASPADFSLQMKAFLFECCTIWPLLYYLSTALVTTIVLFEKEKKWPALCNKQIKIAEWMRFHEACEGIDGINNEPPLTTKQVYARQRTSSQSHSLNCVVHRILSRQTYSFKFLIHT